MAKKVMSDSQKVLRVGLVGCGRIADYHARFIQQSRNARLVGVVDVDGDAACRFGKRYKVASVRGSVEELLGLGELDVVHVLTPPAFHFQCARQALAEGLHVMVEKPLALSAGEVKDLYDLAAANNLSLCPDFPQIFHPKMESALQLLRSGRLGRIAHVESHLTLNSDVPELHQPMGVPWSFTLPAGLLHNYISHPLYLALSIAGEPKSISVTATSSGTLPQGVVDSVVVNIEASNCTASIFVFFRASRVYDVQIYGERGTAAVDFETQTLVLNTHSSLPRAVQRVASPMGRGWQLWRETAGNIWDFARGRLPAYAGLKVLIERFYETIVSGAAAPISRELAIGVAEVEDAIVRHGTKWHLDVATRPSCQTFVFRNEKVLVTGASGYVGFHVVKKLVEEGYYVRALARPTSNTTKLEALGVEVVFGDVRSEHDVVAAAAGIDVIVHLAVALRGTREAVIRTSVDGTSNVAKAAARSGTARVIYVSSLAVYDYTKLNKKITESSPLEDEPQVRGTYSWSKRKAEEVALSHLQDASPSWTVVRPSYIVGDGRDPLAPLGKKIGNTIVCCGGPRKHLRLIHVEDVAGAVLSILQSNETRGQVFTVSDAAGLTCREYLDAMRKINSSKTRIVYVPYVIAWSGAQALKFLRAIRGKGPTIHYRQLRYLYCDASANSEALSRHTGWQPRTVVQMLLDESLKEKNSRAASV